MESETKVNLSRNHRIFDPAYAGSNQILDTGAPIFDHHHPNAPLARRQGHAPLTCNISLKSRMTPLNEVHYILYVNRQHRR